MPFIPLTPTAPASTGPTPSFTPLVPPSAPAPAAHPTNGFTPDPNMPTPCKQSVANLKYNLGKLPGEINDIAHRIPGAKLGEAVGNSIGAIGASIPPLLRGDIAGSDAALKMR